jgi:hypothetical protein
MGMYKCRGDVEKGGVEGENGCEYVIIVGVLCNIYMGQGQND